MNHEERLIHVAKDGKNIRDALNTLERAGFDLTQLETDYSVLREALETYVPENYPDDYRIRRTAIDISEHLTGSREMSPIMLHCPSSHGRAYTLSPAQRAILKERYGMTPTKEVIVAEIAVWPAAPTCVRHIVLKSTEHVPDNRKHVLNACVIDDWVAFCRAVDSAAHNAYVTSEKEKLAARVDRLLARADDLKIEYSITKGKILFKWLAEYETIPVDLEDVVKQNTAKDALRKILLDHNEPKLAELIKDSKVFDEPRKQSAGNEKFADLLSQYL